MKELVIITNILTPYRQDFFDVFHKVAKEEGIEIKVFAMSRTEKSRDWVYENLARDYTELLDKKVLAGKEDVLYYSPNLYERLCEIKPDMIVLAGSYILFPIWQALCWSKKNNCKVLFWSESHLDETRTMNRAKYFAREIIRKIFYKSVDGFWYPGEKAKTFIDKYVKSKSVFIQVANTVNGEKLLERSEMIKLSVEELRRKYGLSLEKRIFFSPARLIAVKGFEEFLEVIKDSDLKDRVQIVIAGNGELRERIQRIAREEKIDIILLGHRNSVEVAELFKASDFMLLPSVSDANPLVCVEALWYGKPLLVSEHVGNYPEVVNEGVNGYVFSYQNQENMLKKFESMLLADSRWLKNAEKCSMEIAMARFDVWKVCRNALDTIKGVIKDGTIN